MNFENLGFALCKIVSKDKKTKDVNIYFATHDDKDKIKYPVETIMLHDKNESIQHLPYTMKSNGNTRQILYVTGAIVEVEKVTMHQVILRNMLKCSLRMMCLWFLH